MKYNMKVITCFRCGYDMTQIQVCHLRCLNCGTEMDCSDKGLVW